MERRNGLHEIPCTLSVFFDKAFGKDSTGLKSRARNSLRTHGAFFESWHVPVPALCSEIRGPNLLTGRLLNSILSLIHCCVSCRIWLGSSILFHEVFPL